MHSGRAKLSSITQGRRRSQPEAAQNANTSTNAHPIFNFCGICTRSRGICLQLSLMSLTHDCDIVLDLEQSFLSTLSQHAEAITVVGVVQWYAIHAEETVTRSQCALSDHTQTQTNTDTHTHNKLEKNT